ncbi:MAG: hypothetical protein XD93_0886, partial [candidate division WS6 bacterium 34_10]
ILEIVIFLTDMITMEIESNFHIYKDERNKNTSK